ncbi:MAG: glycosyl hydrolase [Kordiimonadaceae bacterium]|jgi:photosystem II stability/assembly factor-like uncharacterized protein|nr:glycosyl hydrolase [Kordiimonadaceae bacterium]MBT6330523.1 glycosyl hydrolase [Kordiimonadaceae bacterium]
MSKLSKLIIALGLFSLIGLTNSGFAQDVDPELYKNMKWRDLGFSRGGRSTTSAGIAEDHLTYYMGTTGGGLWKTENAGNSWKNISDGHFETATIGAIDVADSDPNVVYVGTGEAPLRGMKLSHGDGVYKSTDAGETWTNVGLKDSRQIARMRIHPNNPDVVYVAVQGNPWGGNEERGVYKTSDGGVTWEKSLFINDLTGAVDISMDMSNPRILYAAMWDHKRDAWQVRSGGGSNSSAIYKTTDGGENWEKIGKGLPDEMGKIGVDVSQANPNKVYAIVEAEGEKGGMYRSDDGGKNFSLISHDHILKARSWYYQHIFADPNNENVAYILNAPIMKTIDGGKTWARVSATHGDNHDLWINPSNSDYMINSNDGGASVSLDGGKSWSTQLNQTTAQIYRLSVDNAYPYRVYGSQQDNSSVSLPSRSKAGGLGIGDWVSTGGGESAHIAFDPNDPKLVYSSAIAGGVVEWNRDTKQTRNIVPYPERTFAVNPAELKYRANWNPPIIASPHDPATIYYGAQHVLKSTDRGQSWTEISPDLTLNDKSHQGDGGVPFTNEQVSGENYNTLFYLVESPLQKGVIWSGSDDGLVYVTTNEGESWDNVTPRGVEEWQINAIETSPHNAGTAYVAVTGYKANNFEPHVYRTDDYGDSWDEIVGGLPEDNFVRVVREDPITQGLLYAGTETGLFISFNNGDDWQEFQADLPETPITDLRLAHGDLIAATQGRGFWILDDVNPIREMAGMDTEDNHLFKVRDAYRLLSGRTLGGGKGKNPPNGTIINYHLAKDTPEDIVVKIDISDDQGNLVKSYASDANKLCKEDPYSSTKANPPGNKAGLNQFVWNLKSEPLPCNPGLVHPPRSGTYIVAPGAYTVKLSAGDYSATESVNVLASPDLSVSANYDEYKSLTATLHAAANEMIGNVQTLDKIKKQIDVIIDVSGSDTAKEEGEKLKGSLMVWHNKIINTNLQTFQDIIRYPNKMALNFSFLLEDMSGADIPMNKGMSEVADRYMSQWAAVKTEYLGILSNDVQAFNAAMKEAGLPEVYVP